MQSRSENLPQNNFSAAEIKRLAAETFVKRVDYHKQIGSTNDRALELAKATEDQFPLLVLTELQTAGRGQGSKRWWSGSGALTFSVVLATEAAQLPTQRWPQVSLTVGLAVSEALEELLSRGVPAASLSTLPMVSLKWPNDVYIEGRKICGILVEVPRDCPGRLLLGIGINVNNSAADAPAELRNTATTLFDLTGREFALTDVLIELLKRLSERLQPADFWNSEIREGWRRRCLLSGQKIQIDLGVRQATGICGGIDDDGALQLEVDGTLERHYAGAITLLKGE